MRTWLLLLLLLNQSCGGENKPSPELADCGSTGCHRIPGSSRQSTGGGSNSDVDAGNGIALAVNAVAFAGASSDTRAWSPLNVKLVSEAVAVRAVAASGSILTDSGPSPVALSPVATGVYAWVSARPTATSSVYLPGLVSIANWNSDQVNVPLLLSNDFSFVSGLSTMTPLSFDLTQAQVVVKIVDAQGNGVRNARIVNPGAATLAYANLGAWVDASLEPYTDSSGRVVLINFPAPTSPGGWVTVAAFGNNLAGTKVTATVALPVEAGYVSYGTILLNLG